MPDSQNWANISAKIKYLNTIAKGPQRFLAREMQGGVDN